MAKVQPLGDRVLLKPLEAEEKTKGGIILPDTAKEKPQEGEVVAIGAGQVADGTSRFGEDLELPSSLGHRVEPSGQVSSFSLKKAIVRCQASLAAPS